MTAGLTTEGTEGYRGESCNERGRYNHRRTLMDTARQAATKEENFTTDEH
jgi:hypothetical protein